MIAIIVKYNAATTNWSVIGKNTTHHDQDTVPVIFNINNTTNKNHILFKFPITTLAT
jgi:hypothetical protein